MNTKIKIVHIIEQLCIGGKESFVVNLCNKLDSNLFEIYVISLTNYDLTLKERLNSNVQLFCLDFTNPMDLQKSNKVLNFLFKIPFRLAKILRTIKPNIVHSHNNYLSLLYTALAAKLYSPHCHFVQTIHITNNNYINFTVKYKIITLIERFSFRLNKTSFISIAKTTFKNVENFYKGTFINNRLIFSGIDILRFKKDRYSYISKHSFGYNDDDILAVYVARLDGNKNQSVIINALRDIIVLNKKIKLILVGDGPSRFKLEKLVEESNLEDNVRITGYVDNVPEYLAIADIGIISSFSEAFPLVLLEKMSMGLPIIASNIPIFREFIEPGVNGYLFDPVDSIMLAKYLVKLGENSKERESFGLKGMSKARYYSIERMVKEYEECYIETVRNNK